ncbi:MAG: nucleotidyltransferase domain-containing protein [Candidatus Eisenbacteria bacterium]
MKKGGSKNRDQRRIEGLPGRSSISSIFPNQALLDTLSLLLLHPEEEFYQREIAERIGRTVIEVQRALRRVESAGLATRSRRGNRVYYLANRNHPAFSDLKSLLLKTCALGDALRRTLATVGSKIVAAFIFGSFAAGTESPSSDIDLLAVGTLSSREASRVLGGLGRKLGREFNPIVYTVEELRSRMKRESRFIEEVIRGPKIWLIGDEDELERLVA